MLKATGKPMPVDQPSGQLQPSSQQIAHQIEHLRRPQALAQELHAGLIELVGLIENHHSHRWQQLGYARLAHRHIGKKQVVIDHHHVRGHGLLAGVDHMTGLKARTGRAQAIFTRRGHQRQHSRSLVEAGQFGQIAGLCGLRPGFDASDQLERRAVAAAVHIAGLLQAVQAHHSLRQCSSLLPHCCNWRLHTWCAQ